MKIVGEELGGIGRWYVASSLLLIAFLMGVLFLATEGQLRLNAANQRVYGALKRQQALIEFVAAISDAESAQRLYLLTGETSFRGRYQAGVPTVLAALERVGVAFDADQRGNDLRDLKLMTARELEELAAGAALYAKQGAALSVRADTDAGWRTMEALVREAADMRTAEEAKLNAATRSWQADYRLARWVSSSGAVLNIGLVILASALVYADVRWRVRQAIALRSQKRELEREVAARTQELAALSTHLQGVSEQEKSALSRELHDELGGLLVAASMDLSWLEQRLPSTDPGILQRFQRIHESLSAGVDLKRRVVEELRPTLLDNMGLFAALRWQFKETCRRAGLLCVETIPEAEMKFHPDASIGIFRIAQEALTNILKHAKATRAELHVVIEDDVFLLRVSDNGAGIPPNPPHQALSHGLASMRHRVSALGGRWDIRSFPAGGTVLTATIPLGRLLSA